VLSNLETDQEKLIQIVLVARPELLDKIATPEWRNSISACPFVAHHDLDEKKPIYIHHV